MPSEPTAEEQLSRAMATLDRAELMDLGSAPRGAMRQMAMTLHDAIQAAIGATRATWPIPDHVGVRLAISEEDLATSETLLLQGPSAIVLVPLVERLRGDLSDVIHLMRNFQAADQHFQVPLF
jgi:hypothetical protein